MFKPLYMQLKREIWEYKGFIIKAPLILISVVVSLFLLAILITATSKNIYVTADGELQIFEHQLSQQILFDSNQYETLNHLDKKDHTFSLPPHIIAEDFPELIWYEKELNDIPNNQVLHAYKQSIDNRISQLSTLFEFFILIFIIAPLVAGLESERRDRSILFWRALPVSEKQNVLTKAFNAFVLIPVVWHLALFATLGICLLEFAVVEYIINPEGLVLTSMFSQSYWEVIAMSKAFVFKLLWFSPIFATLAFIIAMSVRSIFVIPIIILFSLIVTIVEKLMFQSDIATGFVKEYFSTGFDSSYNIKWRVLWGDYYPHVPYEGFYYIIPTTMVLFALTIWARRRIEV